MKFAGYKLNKNNWPTITVGQLKALGISPAELRRLFQNASLEQTPIGNRTKIGFYLQSGTNERRPMCIRS